MEISADWVEPTDYPLLLGAKIGAPEGALFSGAPAVQIGVFNLGTKRGVTDQAITHLIVGRSLPAGLGRLHASGYVGNAKLLRSSEGDRENAGFMIGYDRGFLPVASQDGEYNKFVLAADFASGDNSIGGGGVGISWYVDKNVSLLFGPVWFNDRRLNGDWKWTTQLDINL
jgi:hypothetical protein